MAYFDCLFINRQKICGVAVFSDLTTEEDITSSVTFPYATLLRGFVYKKGNICSIKCDIKITEEIGNGYQLISNIPVPLANSDTFVKMCPVRSGVWTLSISKYHFQILGARNYISNGTQTLTADDVVELDWTYIIDE